MSEPTPKRRPGRPASGRSINVLFNVSPETLKRLDEQRGPLSRSAFLEKLMAG